MDAPVRPELFCTATIDGEPCDKPHAGNGFCQGHMKRSQRGSDMDTPWLLKDSTRTCEVVGCNEEYEANGLCHNHYMYDRRDRKRAAQVEPNGFEVERLNARLTMFGNSCWLCGKPIEAGQFHVEHVKPLTKGGAHTPSN